MKCDVIVWLNNAVINCVDEHVDDYLPDELICGFKFRFISWVGKTSHDEKVSVVKYIDNDIDHSILIVL